MDNFRRRVGLSWASLGLLTVLCCVLAVLQYRWIGEVSRAEHDRMKASLQSALGRLSHAFSSELAEACAPLLATVSEIESRGKQAAYSARYRQWKQTGTHQGIFARIAIAEPSEETFALYMLDSAAEQFAPAEWPEKWYGMRDRLRGRVMHGQPGPYAPEDSTLIEQPRFGRDQNEGGASRITEQEWLILEVATNYVRDVWLPSLVQRYLGTDDYALQVFVRAEPHHLIYSAGLRPGQRIHNPDAGITLFSLRPPLLVGGPQRSAPRIAPAGDPAGGRWQMLVRHQSGSVEALVARARWRNLGISAALLLLLLATGYMLVRLSREAHELAALQMNFVAGVSHELRTPLTVLRTAGFNLSGRVARSPEQVERYGRMIEQESQRLTTLVEQILQFAAAQAGRPLRKRQPVAVAGIIEAGLQSADTSACCIDKHLEPDLPAVIGDEVALRHVVRNLVDNAVRYGTEASNWIGISARAVTAQSGPAVELRVADRGPGIPHDEQEHIFDAFYRGRHAVDDQIHGTGLGLNLVKKIVEAHGGNVSVHSEPGKGAEFIVRLPAASVELSNDEFAHSAG